VKKLATRVDSLATSSDLED